jgi:acyl-coenzyme A thioesterase PaaI-like protein
MSAASRRETSSPYGEWAGTMGSLMSYRYLASRPSVVDDGHAEGLMRLRHDLRSPGGMLGAPLAIAMLDVAGINIDRINICALTQVNLNLLDQSADINEVFIRGRVLHQARTAMFTEAQFYDASQPDRVIGFGAANWSIIAQTPEGFVYPDPGIGIPDSADAPPLWQAYTGRRRADGRLEIPGMAPEVGTTLLHHGPIQVVLEAAGFEAAAACVGTDRLALHALATTLLRPGRVGPFVATPTVFPISNDAVACRVELHDEGNAGRLIAATFVRFRVVDRIEVDRIEVDGIEVDEI